MLHWATRGSAPRTDDGRFRQPGTRRPSPDSWPFAAREYRALLAIGRTVRNLQPQVPEEEIEAIRAHYRLSDRVIHGWDLMSRSQQLDILATEILRADKEACQAERKRVEVTPPRAPSRDQISRYANMVLWHQWPFPYSILTPWQASERVRREKPFVDMDGVIDMLRAHHRDWTSGWFRLYGEWGTFEQVGEPSGHAMVLH